VDGVIYCRVQRDAVTNVQGRTFDLRNGKYHLLVASGSSLKENSVGYHDIGRLPSAQPINLAEVQDLSGSSRLLIQLHGAFMIAAWIGTTSLGIIFARYFKQTWVGSQSCGKDQWFAWHRLLMVTTWSLTVAAYVLIWVELKQAVWHAHSIIGLITVILCFIQPIGALFRPGPNDKKRPYFNWGHWLGGNLAHILGSEFSGRRSSKYMAYSRIFLQLLPSSFLLNYQRPSCPSGWTGSWSASWWCMYSST